MNFGLRQTRIIRHKKSENIITYNKLRKPLTKLGILYNVNFSNDYVRSQLIKNFKILLKFIE